LYLNIWKPASVGDRQLPVMVWIHGGGFVNGGSSSADSTGEGIAARGLLFVSFNYRLGRFGFFAFPALNDEPTHRFPVEAKGNYGLMDQVAALRWVRRNIAQFGGDPNNVTVVGESAGGISIHLLLTAPITRGLFDKAIVQSGGGRTLLARRHLTHDVANAKSATTLGLEFARKQGIAGRDREALQALRSLNAKQIASGLNMVSLLGGDASLFAGPMVDDVLLVEPPESVYLAGRQHRVPMIVGTTSADLGWNSAATLDEAFATFGPGADLARSLYGPRGDSDLKRINSAIGADRIMAEPARFIARSMERQKVPVYYYRFSYVLESKRPGSPWGAQHATDVPFAFDRLEAVHGPAVTAADRQVSRAMAGYWANFAKRGDPNDATLPQWPRYQRAADTILEFTADGPAVAKADPLRRRLDLIEQPREAR
jgi:para-nitrobenzyl esterase